MFKIKFKKKIKYKKSFLFTGNFCFNIETKVLVQN